jgi:hypothetical protein
MSLTSFPPSSTGKQNFYGFKYDPINDSLTIEEYLWGDTSAQIIVPQINDDGTVYARYDDTYYTTALTQYEFSFSWDTTNYDQLIMEVN